MYASLAGGVLSSMNVMLFESSMCPRLSILLYSIYCVPSTLDKVKAPVYAVQLDQSSLHILYSVEWTPEPLSAADMESGVEDVTSCSWAIVFGSPMVSVVVGGVVSNVIVLVYVGDVCPAPSLIW